MKKTLLILAALITITMVGGSLYNTLANLTQPNNEVREYASANPLPHDMPDFAMAPMPPMNFY